MKKIGDQATNDDVLDIRIRFLRRESPMLFRAIEQFSGRLGDRARNGFIRQLMEMGLVVQEERMRRMDGLSTRISGGFVDEVLGSASAIKRSPTPVEPAGQATQRAPITANESSVTSAQAPAGNEHTSAVSASVPSTVEPAARPVPTPAAETGSATPLSAARTAAAPARDDDRPPPRVPGFAGRRMLAGESFE